ncbi:MAG: ATP-binding protein [Prevotellaceae bacterium]|jgi:hypothetical protein|nr:ATP-binding protein [Prevotellaceae bacterium]
MHSSLRICGVHIKKHGQLDDVYINMAYPQGHPMEGEPLQKVCFVGINGTGKSSLLQILRDVLLDLIHYREIDMLALKLKVGNQLLYTVHTSTMPKVLMFKTEIEQEERWLDKLMSTFLNTENFTLQQYLYSRYLLQGHRYNQLVQELPLKNGLTDRLIYSPSELDTANDLEDIAATTLRDAEELFSNFPFYHLVAEKTRGQFWKTAIYQECSRDRQFRACLDLPQNQDKKVSCIKSDFEQNNPRFLKKLAVRWSDFLTPQGLRLEPDMAVPTHLGQGMELRLSKTFNAKKMALNQLSAGTRRLLFTLGHIYALFYNFNVQRGFLLIDGIENNVHPDLIQKALDAIPCISDAQLFVSTHSPIVQAMFEPCEIVELKRSVDGFVSC